MPSVCEPTKFNNADWNKNENDAYCKNDQNGAVIENNLCKYVLHPDKTS